MGASTEEQLIQKEREIEATRARLSQDTDELGDKLSPQRMVQRRTEAAKGRMSSLRERVMGTTSSVSPGGISEVADTVGGSVPTGTHRGQSATEGNPLAAGLVAFGAGMVLSAVFPATEEERHLGRAAVDTARDHGQPLLDEAKSAGADVAENMKEQVAGAGEELRATAQDSVATVKDEARSSAENVKDEAQQSGSRGSTGNIT
jgi:gas vesicle protein